MDWTGSKPTLMSRLKYLGLEVDVRCGLMDNEHWTRGYKPNLLWRLECRVCWGLKNGGLVVKLLLC